MNSERGRYLSSFEGLVVKEGFETLGLMWHKEIEVEELRLSGGCRFGNRS